MRRREFIAGLGGSALPFSAFAQQSSAPVIGLLGAATPSNGQPFVAAVCRGLNQVGFVEGRNLIIEYRWAEGQYERLPRLAADLVSRRVAAIVTMGNTAAALAGKAATQTIPIIFCVGSDPVRFGLVASLARPTANLTGITVVSGELMVKRIELAREIVSAETSFGLLINQENPSGRVMDAELAARALGVPLVVLNASTRNEIETAFFKASQERVGMLLVQGEPLFFQERNLVIGLAARYAMPAMYGFREFVDRGGLISYGADILDGYRIAGTYLGRILKGEQPKDLPVQQPAKLQLVINLKTAKTLGLAIPETLLATVDEVIQ